MKTLRLLALAGAIGALAFQAQAQPNSRVFSGDELKEALAEIVGQSVNIEYLTSDEKGEPGYIQYDIEKITLTLRRNDEENAELNSSFEVELASDTAHASTDQKGCLKRYRREYRAKVGSSPAYWTCQNSAYEDAANQRLLNVDIYFGTTYWGPYNHGVKCGGKANWPPSGIPYGNHDEIHDLLCHEKWPEKGQ